MKVGQQENGPQPGKENEEGKEGEIAVGNHADIVGADALMCCW